ncbi:outer membrane protein assembly complex, YaeT protein [Pseudomonas putida DOT-T1E]|uniref:Outer membrane protein assembly complex, YaeT protein n=6 Tax=Pseudomonas putida group TaxID=136845 RepID=I7BUK3_PSEPT|nr:outer membrane protein assembly complex, YaeT protein [Pseudomonas putida DOT-T1E]
MNYPRLLLSILLLKATLAQASPFRIADIRVNGLQRVSAGSVFGALPLNVGDQADDRRLVDSTRSLFKTGFFQDIQLSRDGNVLIINVVERPSVSSIEIEGNKAISTEDLMKGLKQSGLAEGEIFQRATLEGVRNELQRQYVAQGRYSAEVDAEVEIGTKAFARESHRHNWPETNVGAGLPAKRRAGGARSHRR